MSASWWSGVLLLAVSAATAQDQVNLALAPVEQAPPVSSAEAEVYYQGLAQACAAHKQDLKIIERRQLKLLQDETDLAAALGSDSAVRTYSLSARQLRTERVLVPAACKIEADFVLTLRIVSVGDGATKVFAARKTRLTNKFAGLARSLVDEVLGPPGPVPSAGTDSPPPAAAGPEAIDFRQLREACVQAKVEELFPALWKRAEDIAAKAGPLNPAYYYDSLLHLSARATNPPEGMRFVPGGYAVVPTSAGPRRLWVEPFFIDTCEVSVADYRPFLDEVAKSADAQVLRQCRPLTLAHAQYNDPAFPVSGVSYEAARRYAAWRGRALPTMLQWMRAAYAEADDHRLPCGDAQAAAKCNLAGAADGFAVLAPAAGCEADTSPFGVRGMTGNVREWTQSWHDKDLYARCREDDPRECEQGTMKVVLGGSFRTPPGRAERASTAGACRPGECMDDVGFRCARPFFRAVQD